MLALRKYVVIQLMGPTEGMSENIIVLVNNWDDEKVPRRQRSFTHIVNLSGCFAIFFCNSNQCQ